MPFYSSNRPKPPVHLREYVVVTGVTDVIKIEAHFMFNEEYGLIFRRYIDDNPNNRTKVVALFAPGHWQRVVEI